MNIGFYKEYLDDADDFSVEHEITNFYSDDDLDVDLFYEARLEVGDKKYRIQVSEDTSPHTPTVSNYEVEIAEKKPLEIDDGYTDWSREDKENFLKRSEKIFPKTLTSHIEDEIGITFDEEQETI
jgi:hypothetical protein